MKTTIMFIFITLLSSFLLATDMQKYLHDTEAMIKSAKYKKALERVEWFHAHVLEYEPAMSAVRLSYALSDWKTLGDLYLPALTSMKQTRDKGEKLLLNGEGNKALFHDVVSLNEALDEEEKSISLFRKLHREQNELAQKCWYIIKDTIIKHEDYDIIKLYIQDPLKEWKKLKSRYEYTKRFDQEHDVDTFSVNFHRDSFIADTIQLINIAKKYNDIESAKIIESRAKKILNN